MQLGAFGHPDAIALDSRLRQNDPTLMQDTIPGSGFDQSKGMDYGVLPRLMAMANPALPELWREARCAALGFMLLPTAHGLRDVPTVALVFQSIEGGRRFFDLLKSFDGEQGSGSGTDISFIQDSSASVYTLVIKTNEDELLNRMFDQERRAEYAINVATIAVAKEFPLSENLAWLREKARRQPVLFVPASSAGPDIAAGFLKKNISFCEREELPRESAEYFLTGRDEGVEPGVSRSAAVVPASIAERRRRQIDRFFPITAARLPFNPAYQAALRSLNNFAPWQILQAACNLTCTARFPDLVQPDGSMDWIDVYEALRHLPESVASDLALQFKFSDAGLREQLTDDARYLCSYLTDQATNADPFQTLVSLGMMEPR